MCVCVCVCACVRACVRVRVRVRACMCLFARAHALESVRACVHDNVFVCQRVSNIQVS